MSELIPKEKVEEILRSAFRPLECVVEFDDIVPKYGFRVYLRNGAFRTQVFSSLAMLQNARHLAEQIDEMRGALMGLGTTLDLWIPPPEMTPAAR